MVEGEGSQRTRREQGTSFSLEIFQCCWSEELRGEKKCIVMCSDRRTKDRRWINDQFHSPRFFFIILKRKKKKKNVRNSGGDEHGCTEDCWRQVLSTFTHTLPSTVASTFSSWIINDDGIDLYLRTVSLPLYMGMWCSKKKTRYITKYG